MNNIQIFQNNQFGQIRVATTESGDPLFCLADICQALHLTNNRKVKSQLDDDVTLSYPITDNLGREQQATFVTEPGMYTVILRSDSPKAKPMQKWVTSEVLPTIRKHGVYATADTVEKMLDDPDMAIRLLQGLKEERAKRLELEERVEAQAPAVTFTSAVVGSQNSCLIGELAKILRQNGVQIGEKRLFEWLRRKGYLGRCGERHNIPNQQYVEQGLFELKKGVRTGNSGVLHTTITPKITGKGQVYFVNKFLNNHGNRLVG